MKKIKKQLKPKGFTFAEILTVLFIIAAIITVATISFSSIREKSRNNKRISDVKQIQLALEEYYKDQRLYPSSLEFGQALTTPDQEKTYLSIIPNNPSPRAEGPCSSQEYEYFYDIENNSYIIYFCLSKKTGDFKVGINCVQPEGVMDSCLNCLNSDDLNCEWQQLGNVAISSAGAEFISLYVDNNAPYISYIQTESRRVTVSKYTGQGETQWSNIGMENFSEPESLYTSLYVHDNIPYVAYINNDGRPQVEKYIENPNGNWTDVGDMRDFERFSSFPSLKINKGNLYLAYKSDELLKKVSLIKYTGQGQVGWEYVGDKGFSADSSGYVSLFIYQDIPYIAHVENNGKNELVAVMKYDKDTKNNYSWQYVGSPFVSDRASYTSIFIQNDIIYLSYINNDEGGRVNIFYYDLKDNQSGWKKLIISDFSGKFSNYPTLFVYKSTPYVGFSDGDVYEKAHLIKYDLSDKNNFKSIGQAGFSTSNSYYLSLFIKNGTPYLAFSDKDKTNRAVVWIYKQP